MKWNASAAFLWDFYLQTQQLFWVYTPDGVSGLHLTSPTCWSCNIPSSKSICVCDPVQTSCDPLLVLYSSVGPVFVLSLSVVRNYWMSPAEFTNMNKHNSPQRWAPSGNCRCGLGQNRPVWSVLRWWPGCSVASGHGEPRGASAGSPAPGAAGTSYPVRTKTERVDF